jgi:hypothetical protein
VQKEIDVIKGEEVDATDVGMIVVGHVTIIAGMTLEEEIAIVDRLQDIDARDPAPGAHQDIDPVLREIETMTIAEAAAEIMIDVEVHRTDDQGLQRIEIEAEIGVVVPVGVVEDCQVISLNAMGLRVVIVNAWTVVIVGTGHRDKVLGFHICPHQRVHLTPELLV